MNKQLKLIDLPDYPDDDFAGKFSGGVSCMKKIKACVFSLCFLAKPR